MATCRGCGAKVGCGCQLVDGLCAKCRNTIKTVGRNVISTINHLFGMC